MNNNYKIYFLSSNNSPEEIRYIGFTKNSLKERLYKHISESIRKNNTHKHKWINSVFKNNNNINISILEDNLEYEKAIEREIFYIDFYKKGGVKLTNSTLGGEGLRATPEIRKKISISNTGKKPSLNTRIKMSQSHKGVKLSENHRKNISNANKGRIMSEFNKKQLLISLKKPASQEKKIKISLANKGKTAWNKGIKMSDDFRLKMSLVKKGKPSPRKGVILSQEIKNKISNTKKQKQNGKITIN